ncbi:hypothetical protein ACQP00_45565 [Dactylosporangium sp. CS-047395]|uniref:hypothetical protein n=1 Tax=Dactylosporangium sp. CS-047395 TaxID=3239936 RepID=UPI003D922103
MRCLKAAGTALAGLAAATALGAAAHAEPEPTPSSTLVEPQPLPSSATVDNQNPVAGGTVVVTGHGFNPFEWVSFDATIDLAAATRARNDAGAARARNEAGTHLAVAQADGNGDTSATIQVPAGFTGQLPILLTGQTSGTTLAVAVTVAAAPPGAGAVGGITGLPVTGPGALAYTAAGLAFIVGGAGLVTVARLRRTAHVAAHASR